MRGEVETRVLLSLLKNPYFGCKLKLWSFFALFCAARRKKKLAVLNEKNLRAHIPPA